MPLFNPASGAADHIADTSDAHDASAISIADAGGYTSTSDAEAAFQEIYARDNYELEYTETTTSDTSITATTSGTAETFITASAVVLDGSTRIAVEFYSSLVLTPGGANNRGTLVELWGAKDGGAAAAIAVIANPFGASNVSFGQQVLTCNYLTPASGSWVYSIRAYVTGGTGQILAGSGGAGAYPAAYIRISRAPGS